MAFPVVLNRSLQTFSSTGTPNHNVAMPASGNANSLLIVTGVTTNATAAVDWQAVGGWTRILTNFYTNNGLANTTIWVKKATGSEFGTNINFPLTSNGSAKLTVHHIQEGTWNHDIATGIAIASAKVNANTPNPPNLAPGWGSLDILWLAIGVMRDLTANTGVTAPTNYSNLLYNETSSLRALAVAERQLNASSENPGTFANYIENSVANNTVGVTIAIKPSEPTDMTPSATYRVRGVSAPILSTGLELAVADLTGLGLLTATGIITFAPAGAVTLSGLGNLVVSGGNLLVFGLADLTGAGSLVADGFGDVVEGVATITGLGSIVVLAEAFVSGIAALTGVGSIAVTADITAVTGSAILTGHGTLIAGPNGVIFVVANSDGRRAARNQATSDGYANLNQEEIARRARINVPTTERL